MKSIIFYSPLKYFDSLLSKYMYENKSLLFSEEMTVMAETKSANEFFSWLDSINFIPLYSPQTFLLDDRKRVDAAKEKLKWADYVVIEEGVEALHKEAGISVTYDFGVNSKVPPVSLSDADLKWQERFVGKDMQLYEYACELWKKIEAAGYIQLGRIIKRYKPMQNMANFHGMCGGMYEKMIRGFAFNRELQEPLELEIYKNGTLLTTTVANHPRPELKEKFSLKIDKCGILVKFDKPTIQPGDKIEVVIVPENVLVPIVGSAKAFLEGE